MVFNTTFGAQSVIDSYSIRRTALMHGVAYFTTVAGMHAAVDGIMAMQREGLDVETIQGYYLR
jgi:carbamoyl-phosphate synthase large subunit